MHRHLQAGWRWQRYLALGYVATGFLAALAIESWQLPARMVDSILDHAHTLSLLATVAWNPDGARAWFAFMLLLGVAWTLPLGLAVSRGAELQGRGKVLLLGVPVAAACLFAAWAFVDGLGLWIPGLAEPGGRAAPAIQIVVGSAFRLGLYGGILLVVATFLACMPFAALFLLGKGRAHSRLGDA
jgi:hypothetical protein